MSGTRVFSNFCFTLFALDIDVAAALLGPYLEANPCVRYAIAGKETCPVTDRLHLQGYLQFMKRVSLNTAKRAFHAPEWSYKPHMEIQMAEDSKKAIDYCRKDGDIAFEVGTPNLDKPGKRNDLKRVREAIVEGESYNELFRNHPDWFGTLIRYPQGLSKGIHALQKRPCTGPLEAEWHFGPTGSGKSYWAYNEAPEGEEAYTKSGDKWWDGYDAESLVIFDDIRGGNNFVNLLRLLDGRLKLGQIKGSHTSLKVTRVIFTCPYSIYQWAGRYAGDENIEQLRRRVGRIVQWTGYKQFTVIKPIPAGVQAGHAPSYNP